LFDHDETFKNDINKSVARITLDRSAIDRVAPAAMRMDTTDYRSSDRTNEIEAL